MIFWLVVGDGARLIRNFDSTGISMR